MTAVAAIAMPAIPPTAVHGPSRRATGIMLPATTPKSSSTKAIGSEISPCLLTSSSKGTATPRCLAPTNVATNVASSNRTIQPTTFMVALPKVAVRHPQLALLRSCVADRKRCPCWRLPPQSFKTGGADSRTIPQQEYIPLDFLRAT